MGWLSDTWDSTKDAVSSGWDTISDEVSSGWDSTKDAVKGFTGIQSMNDLLLPGLGVASGLATLQGQGWAGEQLQKLNGQQQPPPGTQAATGPLTQSAPAGMTMGAGGQAPAQTLMPSGGVAGLFGESGYQYGPQSTSSALLQYNPEAYQYRPLMSGVE